MTSCDLHTNKIITCPLRISLTYIPSFLFKDTAFLKGGTISTNIKHLKLFLRPWFKNGYFNWWNIICRSINHPSITRVTLNLISYTQQMRCQIVIWEHVFHATRWHLPCGVTSSNSFTAVNNNASSDNSTCTDCIPSGSLSPKFQTSQILVGSKATTDQDVGRRNYSLSSAL